MLEDFLEVRGGEHVVEGSFILHGVRALIYPDAPYWLVTTAGVMVCSVILAVYAWRGWIWWSKKARRNT
jgi:hypothetical protein